MKLFKQLITLFRGLYNWAILKLFKKKETKTRLYYELDFDKITGDKAKEILLWLHKRKIVSDKWMIWEDQYKDSIWFGCTKNEYTEEEEI